MNREKWFEKINNRIIINENWCHIRQWALNNSWYGVMKIDWKFWYIHRFVYDYIKWIPEWLTIDHICKNIKCCNINHLQTMSRKDTSKQWWDFSRKNKTILYCDKHNKNRERNKKWYFCRDCRNEYTKEWRKRKKEFRKIGGVVTQ